MPPLRLIEHRSGLPFQPSLATLLIAATLMPVLCAGCSGPELRPSREEADSSTSEAARQAEREGKLVQAVKEAESLGEGDQNFKQRLHMLARFYTQEGKYSEAETSYKRLIAILQRNPAGKDEQLPVALYDLGEILRLQARLGEAEPVLKRALDNTERLAGKDSPAAAMCRANLARLYSQEKRYADAEQMLREVVRIVEKSQGPEGRLRIEYLTTLSQVCDEQGKSAEAEALLKSALATAEKTLGPLDVDLARCLICLGEHYRKLGKLNEAEPIFERALQVLDRSEEPRNSQIASTLDRLAKIDLARGDWHRAEVVLGDALEKARSGGSEDSLVIFDIMLDLSTAYARAGKYADARSCLEQALRTGERVLGDKSAELATALEQYSQLLRKMNCPAEATKIEKRLQSMRREKPGLPASHLFTRIN